MDSQDHINNSEHQATILVVDDDPTVLTEVATRLQQPGYRILVANGGIKASKMLKEQDLDLVLLDIHMPDKSGLDVCREVKQDPDKASLPILFLTSSQSDVEDAFDVGAVDYILKPVKVNELKARVSTHLKISQLVHSLEESNHELEKVNETLEERVLARTQDLVAANTNLRREINERRHLEDKLAYLSRYDFVTRMYNRFSMEDELAKHLLRSPKESRLKSYFLYIDLDQFRVVNDNCSYIAGDELLRQIGELIKECLENEDVVARMGGDEFAVLFECTNSELALNKTRSLKKAIETFSFVWDENVYHISASLGLIELDDGFYDVHQVIGTAERTCFEIKARGGQEISLYSNSKEDIDRTTEQLRWVPLIQSAVHGEGFFLVGQKIHSVKSNGGNKYELLLRLDLADDAVAPPGHFIPVAERYHLITDIDRWVVREAFQQIELLSSGAELSINLSGESFVKDDFVRFVEDILKHNPVYSKQICFEITETSAVTNVEATKHFISRIKPYGCQFALDDFGTGTSSYGHLKELPIDLLKIDGMFVRGVEHERINRLMVESIVAIATEMKIKVVAECVETEAAYAILKDIGVDYIQGFYLHKGQKLSELL